MASQTVLEIQTYEDVAAVPMVTLMPPLSGKGNNPRASRGLVSHTDSVLAAPSSSSSASASAPAPTAPSAVASPYLSRTRTVLVVAQLMGLSLFNSFSNGIIVVGLPAVTESLAIPKSLQIWPSSVFFLTAGSCLLLAGSLADVLGNKRVNTVGSVLATAFALGCGLTRNTAGLIAFRALQGVTNAMIAPSSISIISTSVVAGRPRNIGFGCLGLAAPLGFSLGLVLGGVFVDSAGGWRTGFYLASGITFFFCLVGLWVLPNDGSPSFAAAHQSDSHGVENWPTRAPSGRANTWKRLATEIDWVGTFLFSTGLAMFSYVMATLSSETSYIRKPVTIVLLVISAISVAGAVYWMDVQVKHNRVALIPNALWRSSAFTSCCIMMLLCNASTNCMELFCSLFFQEIQGNSALEASLRILPSLVVGSLASLLAGVFVNRMPIRPVVLAVSAVSAVAAVLMAVIHPRQIYWANAFVAQVLSPLSCDILFPVGLLVVSGVFPMHMQALGGAVFNTCAQLGAAIGLTISSVVSTSVTDKSHYVAKTSPPALMEGYRAVFWTIFACMGAVCVISVWGLRRVGVVGAKRD